MKRKALTKVTLWANRLVALLVGILVFALPGLTMWYCGLLNYEIPHGDYVGILACFYCCALAIFAALWNVDGIMRNILRQQVFIRENVKRVRVIQWCCGIVAAICLVATFFALPMVILVAVTGFLFLVVGVVASILDSAVALQEENDLTV